MAKRPLGAQISHMLKARGVEVIFGIPGVHNQELYRGIEEAGIKHILPRHEQGAGFMADGYARATGKPGVAYVITGPGLLNLLTPMGQAYSDSVPMLVISSCLDPQDRGVGKGKLHEMKDQEGAAATVCDWSKTAYDATSAYQLIDRALMEFSTSRPRPKHLQLPIKLLEGQAEAPPAAAVQVQGYAAPGAAQIARIADELKAAKRPLFILGGGAARAPVGIIRDMLARAGAASFVTYAGRGLALPDDPLSFGSFLARPDAAKVIGSADCVVAVGTELAEVDLWRDGLGNQVPMIRVDLDPATLADGQNMGTRLLSEAERFCRALNVELAGHAPKTAWQPAEVAASRARWRAEVDALYPGILPVAEALRAALPPKTMIYSDMTQFAYAAKEVWDMELPGHWHHPFGFGTLGYALPAAIGGKVGRPNLPVVAIAGDYGFQYTIQELGTAVELGLPLPILLWDNGKLGAIEASMIRAQIAPNAVTLRNPDFLALARAYGAFAEEPGSLDALCAATLTALKAPGPTLIRMRPGLA